MEERGEVNRGGGEGYPRWEYRYSDEGGDAGKVSGRRAKSRYEKGGGDRGG